MQLRLLLMIPKWHKDIFHNFSARFLSLETEIEQQKDCEGQKFERKWRQGGSNACPSQGNALRHANGMRYHYAIPPTKYFCPVPHDYIRHIPDPAVRSALPPFSLEFLTFTIFLLLNFGLQTQKSRALRARTPRFARRLAVVTR